MDASIGAETTTDPAALLVDRDLVATVAAVTTTADAQMVLGVLPAIVDPYIESLTAVRSLESLTTTRSLVSLTARRSLENT